MKVAFFGHFGALNTGNDSSLFAVLSNIRSRVPECDFWCVCTEPAEVVLRTGIDAVPITERVSRIWDRTAPFHRRVLSAPRGVRDELREYRRALRALGGTDVLIVPGTGLLTDAYGVSAWGPYNVFKWALMAKIRGCKLVFLSVGAGPLYSSTGRYLVRAALSLADYRSYRDQASLDSLTEIGFRRPQDRVYPDLAFSLPTSLFSTRNNGAGRQKQRVVGLGLMSYPGRYAAANPRGDTYSAYLRSVVELADWLLGHGYDLRLLLGDEDTNAVEDFLAILRERRPNYDAARVVYEPIPDLETLFRTIADTDVVVATRFHNALLSMLLGKPVLAISFHHKSESLMRGLGLGDFCEDIHQLEASRLISRFEALEDEAEVVMRIVERKVREYRAALDEQYETLVGRFMRSASPGRRGGEAPKRQVLEESSR